MYDIISIFIKYSFSNFKYIKVQRYRGLHGGSFPPAPSRW
uniref:Uncharacterized protein n=1 Tax=Siphoviridae sp. ctbvd11 TaxID=2825567 RepID=A0A8S5QCZ3_9CAUD|nr:MAG TPA: hypothetical protein [Siphoviridae sp. ctbvd11]